LSSHLRLGLPSGLFPSDIPNKTQYTRIFYSIRATSHAHLILLDFITQTILGEGPVLPHLVNIKPHRTSLMISYSKITYRNK